MISIQHLKKSYRRKCVLNDVTLEFFPGITGILGPNGSGKTTLFRILAGLLRQDQGEISYQDTEGKEVSPKQRSIGYLSQNFGLIKDYTVWEQMEYFACLKEIPKREWKAEIENALASVHLQEQGRTKCKKLSGGMVRRVGIAQAIMGNPDFILLDEPTVGLDPEERIRFQDILKEIKGRCPILLATHLVEDIVELCSRTLVLSKGEKLFYDRTEDLAALAKGHVLLLPEGEMPEWEAYGRKIKTMYDMHGKRTIRFLELAGPDCPNKKEWLTEPQIEDGYLYLLRRSENEI